MNKNKYSDEWGRPTLYASGNFGKNILWNTSEVLLLFVLTDLLNIPAAIAGAVILVSLALDALLDPLVGVLAEKLRTPVGQYGPLILVGAPLAAVTFVSLFSLPLLQINQVWVVIIALLAFRAGYTLIDVPHNALLAKASRDSRLRSRIAGLRFVFSSLASLMLALAIAPLVSREEPLSPSGLFIFVCIAGFVSAGIMIVSWLSVKKADIASARRAEPSPNLSELMRSILNNRNYLIVLAVSGMAALTLPLFAKSLLYITRYVMDAPDLAGAGLIFMIAGQFIGLPIWMKLSQARENQTALGGAHILLIAATALFIVLGASHPSVFLALCCFIGVAASGVYSVIWAMMADCVEDGQSRTGDRAEAMLFAFATLVQKSAIGIGAALFGAGLSLSGYAPGVNAAPVVQGTMVGFAAGAPLIGSAICLALLRFYTLSHADHAAASRKLGLTEDAQRSRK